MTSQEIFDRVATHLLTQGEKSSDGNKRCLYRHGSLRCAVGVLIDDGHYQPFIESMTVGEVFRKSNSQKINQQRAMLLKILKDILGLKLTQESPEMALISRLQRLHDDHEPEIWRDGLKEIADEFNLLWNH